jgi:hypothetical protein
MLYKRAGIDGRHISDQKLVSGFSVLKHSSDKERVRRISIIEGFRSISVKSSVVVEAFQ